MIGANIGSNKEWLKIDKEVVFYWGDIIIKCLICGYKTSVSWEKFTLLCSLRLVLRTVWSYSGKWDLLFRFIMI